MTYDGSALDTGLNYSVFLINLVCCIAAVKEQKSYAIICLLSVSVFQWVLCLVLGCSGISIIWCAMAGWIFNQDRLKSNAAAVTNASDNDPSHVMMAERVQNMARSVLVLDLFVVLYYAVVSEAITTVAHTLAVILGAVTHQNISLSAGTDRLNSSEVATPLFTATDGMAETTRLRR